MKQLQIARPGRSGVVSLADEDAVIDLVASSVLKLWGAVSDLARLRPAKQRRFRVTIFGSANVPTDRWVYRTIRNLAAELTEMGCDIVSGGGHGVMQAINEGTNMADTDSDRGPSGVRVGLPFEHNVNAFVSEALEQSTFFTRLHHFVLVSDAFVVLPGGIATVMETMMIWQLLQVRKLHDTPLILVGKMYEDLVEWCRSNMLKPESPLAGHADLAIPTCVEDAKAVLAILRRKHAAWSAASMPQVLV